MSVQCLLIKGKYSEVSVCFFIGDCLTKANMYVNAYLQTLIKLKNKYFSIRMRVGLAGREGEGRGGV